MTISLCERKQLDIVFILDENEVLTYEEVGLLHPSRNHKRPIVLIGKNDMIRYL